MKCDICKQETERTYDLVLFHCGLWVTIFIPIRCVGVL